MATTKRAMIRQARAVENQQEQLSALQEQLDRIEEMLTYLVGKVQDAEADALPPEAWAQEAEAAPEAKLDKPKPKAKRGRRGK